MHARATSERNGEPFCAERGQSTIEWVGLLALVSLLLAGMLGLGIRVPGQALVEAIGSRMVCAVAGAACGAQQSAIVSAYGDEMADTVRRYTPKLLYEEGMSALPVDYRSCRSPTCADGTGTGNVAKSGAGEPVTLFTHVIDCRPGARRATEAAGADCSGDRAGRLYLQFWEYFVDSQSLGGVPVAEVEGFHRDDWEGTQFRINSDGSVDQRAGSHHGYNYEQGKRNWGSDAGWEVVKDASETAGLRPEGGWGPATGYLLVSGGSHAGNVKGDLSQVGSQTRRGDIRLIPLEPLAAAGRDPGFAITPPWVKDAWTDPEAEGTS